MPASLADVGATARAILAAFSEQLQALHVDVPELQYVPAGADVVWDQALLAAQLVDIKQGQPGSVITITQQPRALNFYGEWRLTLLREAPTIGDGPVTMPPPEALEEAGREATSDVAALVRAFSNIALEHTLVDAGEGLVLSSCRPLAQQGGLVGTELVLALSMS